MTQPTLIKLHPKINDTINDRSNRVCVPNKTEDLNVNVFNITTGINASKILTKHASRKCKCKFDDRKCSSNQKWNNDKCWCECKIRKSFICAKEVIFGILLHVVVKMVNR